MTLQQKIAAYVAELERPNEAGNSSHVTLFRLYRQFGRVAVDVALDAHFASQKASNEVQ